MPYVWTSSISVQKTVVLLVILHIRAVHRVSVFVFAIGTVVHWELFMALDTGHTFVTVCAA